MELEDTPPFGTLLKRYRMASGLTQEELAAQAGISARGVSDLERGVRRAPYKSTIALLAEALRLSGQEHVALVVAAGRTAHASCMPVLLDHTGSTQHDLPLIGRTHEMVRLERYFAGEGPPVLLLTGEPGIGKTRLLQESPLRAFALGWTVLEGGCHRRSGQEPYTPLLDAVAGYLHQLLLVQVALAERDLLEGHPEMACERLTPLLYRDPNQEEADVIPLLPLLAWAHLELNREDLAAEMVAESLARASTTAHRLAVLDALRVQAMLALRQRTWQEAESALEEALAQSHALPCPYAEAKVLYVYGLLYTARGESESARERLEAALAICARLGERLYAQRIEQVLAGRWQKGELVRRSEGVEGAQLRLVRITQTGHLNRSDHCSRQRSARFQLGVGMGFRPIDLTTGSRSVQCPIILQNAWC